MTRQIQVIGHFNRRTGFHAGIKNIRVQPPAAFFFPVHGQSLAQGASEQASNLQQISASVEQIWDLLAENPMTLFWNTTITPLGDPIALTDIQLRILAAPQPVGAGSRN